MVQEMGENYVKINKYGSEARRHESWPELLPYLTRHKWNRSSSCSPKFQVLWHAPAIDEDEKSENWCCLSDFFRWRPSDSGDGDWVIGEEDVRILLPTGWSGKALPSAFCWNWSNRSNDDGSQTLIRQVGVVIRGGGTAPHKPVSN